MKNKSTTEPSKFAKPYMSAAANEAAGVYNANKGATAEIASRVQGLLPGLASRFEAGNPAVKAATGYNTDVLSGKYLDGGNPYLQGIIDNSNNDIRNQVQGSLGTRGRTGGDSYFGILSRELGKNETNLRYGDYSAERDRMGQAAGLAPGLANADYAGLQELLAASQLGAELPYAGVNDYVRNIGGLLGNSTTTTQKQGMGGLLAQAAGTALGTYAMSDRRLKTAIRKVGQFADGLGVYQWRYIWGGPEQIGVMADEVEQLRPWALGPRIAGFASVNYGAL